MKIKNQKILVTGGAGFIGSHLVDELARDNYVVVLDNFSSGRMENISHHKNKDNVLIIDGDIRNKDIINQATRDIDLVYHLAVQCLRISINDPEINNEVNSTGTLNLCLAALKNNVRRFIYVSSSEVYGSAMSVPMNELHPLEPTTVYGASKLAGEKYSLACNKTYGLKSMVVRPFNTYGPREHYEGAYGEVIPKFVIRALNNTSPVIFGDGTQTRDFTYVTDTVKGIILASACDEMIGQTVNIARGQEISIKELSALIYKKIGKPDLEPVFEKQRPGDVMRHFADVTKAKELFGFNPMVDIDSGLDMFIQWFLSSGNDFKKLLADDVIFNWEV